MNFLTFCQWLEKTPVADMVNGTEWMFPVVESIHIIGLTLLIGTIVIVDLRLLGLGMQRWTPSELARRLAPYTRLGLCVMLTTGPIMFSADAVRCYYNDAFHFKMIILALALLVHFTIYRKAAASNGGKAAACLSLALWIGVVLGGRAIAFF